jgi:uncharacterized protein (UPF0212 family)
MPFEWLKFAHVLTIIGAIALAEGSILPTYLAGLRRDVLGIRSGVAVSEVGERVATPLALVSIVLGVAAALSGQIDLTASWLISTYVLLALAVGLGIFGGFRHAERIKAAALASPVETPSSDLMRLIRSPWTVAISFVPPMIMGTIIYLMVVKPTLW